MPELAGKFQVVSQQASEGAVKLYRVNSPEGPGFLYWFEVHEPQARSQFFRYRSAIKRLEERGLIPPGVEVSAKPGRYYVFWPDLGELPAPRGRRARRRLEEIRSALAELGYAEDDAVIGVAKGRPLVVRLSPRLGEAPPPPALTPRPRRSPLSWLPGLALALAGVLLATLGFTRYLNPPTLTLPTLVGKTAEEAVRLLKGSGLTVVFVEASLPDEPAGVIVEQSPPPGSRLKPGRRVRLVLNQPEEKQVPLLLGETLSEASAKLAAAGYKLGRVAEAQELLRLAGLTPSEEKRLPAPEPPGTLLLQYPEAGTVVGVGAAVTTVRSGRPEVLYAPAGEEPPPPPPPAPEEAEPPPPPPTATKTPSPSGPSVSLDVRLPENLEGRPVKLVVTDEDGTRVLYEGPTQKGWRLTGEVPVKGKATFELYVGEYLYQRWETEP